jgi:hypothetical protein
MEQPSVSVNEVRALLLTDVVESTKMLVRRLRTGLLRCLFLQRSGRVPLVQHAAHGGDGGASDGSCSPAPAGASAKRTLDSPEPATGGGPMAQSG